MLSFYSFSSWFWSLTLTALLLLGTTTTTTVRSETTTTSEEIAAYIAGIVSEYHVYPPIDPDPAIWDTGTIKPIDVIALQSILSINSIAPQNSEFTATTRFSYYWTANDCNQTKAHQLACDTTLSEGNGFKFVNPKTAKGLPQRLLTISEPNIHREVFEEEGLSYIQPDAEQIETRTTYSQIFDMRYFPWEIHALKIPLTSLYSTEVVKITRLAESIDEAAKPSVPNGWKFLGIQCETSIGIDNTRRSLDGSNKVPDIDFYTYSCTVIVARSNPGWWVTSFLLFSALIFMAYAGSVGMTSHMVAEARDDRDSARRALFDGTRLVGTFTIGLLLTYVFQVQISPYGRSIEYWPRIPTSSMIYVLGLVGIVVQSFAGLMGSILFSRPLLAEGFIGGLLNAYDLDKVPKEGEVGEERAPLLLKKYDPSAAPPVMKKQPDGIEEQAPAGEGEGQQHEGDPTMSRTRRNNTKTYGVLSLEEAAYINEFVKRLFLFKTGLLLAIALAALIMLVVARKNYGDLVTAATEGLKVNSLW